MGQAAGKSYFDKMRESEEENNNNNYQFKDKSVSNISRYDKTNIKQDWINLKDDSTKPLDIPAYDTVYKEPDPDINYTLIIIVVIIMSVIVIGGSGAGFMFVQKKNNI